MAWFFLIISGVLEAFWPMALEASDGLSKPLPSLVPVTIIAGAMYCFSLSVKTISPATAYILFVGMGTIGVFIVEMAFDDEPFILLKALFRVCEIITFTTLS